MELCGSPLVPPRSCRSARWLRWAAVALAAAPVAAGGGAANGSAAIAAVGDAGNSSSSSAAVATQLEQVSSAVLHSSVDVLMRETHTRAPSHISSTAGIGLLALGFAALLLYVRPWAKCKSVGLGNTSVQQAVTVLWACAAFMLVGPSLVLLNKHIMKDLGFPYPLSLSGLGVLTSSVFSKVAVGTGCATVRPESMEVVSGQKWFRTALPVGACKAMTLATGNAAYLYLGVGFIQMLKAMTPAIVLIVMVLLGTSRPSRPAVFFVLVIVGGTIVEVNGEMHATFIGVVLMLISEVCEAINLVMSQKLLQERSFTVMEGMYVLQPPSATCLFFLAAVTEWPTIARNGHAGVVVQNLPHFAAAALLGLAVNFVSMLLVQVTSSLFCKILNTVRCVCLVYFGVLFYGEEISHEELIGYSVSLLGFAGYNYVQIFPRKGDELERAAMRCCGALGNGEENGGRGSPKIREDEI